MPLPFRQIGVNLKTQTCRIQTKQRILTEIDMQNLQDNDRVPAPTCPSTGSICCRVASTNTAVLPIPDLAWQRMSMPRMACGMHSCCTGTHTHTQTELV